MLKLAFKEKSKFETPDGRIWIINPLKRRQLKLVTQFTKLNEQMEKAQKEGNSYEANRLIFGEDEDNEDEKSLISLTDRMIDSSIREENTGKPYPEEYREEMIESMHICTLIIKASIGESEGDGIPLQRNSSSEQSEPETTP